MSSLDPVNAAENAASVPPNALNGDGPSGELLPAAPVPPSPAPSSPIAPPPPQPVSEKPFYRRRRFWFLTIGIVIVIIAVGIYWYSTLGRESTDDAFIAGNIVPISSKVPGTVLRVLVLDNQDVQKGQLLLTIDPSDIQAQLNQAEAMQAAAESKLQAAKTSVELVKANTGATLAQADAQVKQAQAAITAAEAQVASAQADVVASRAESNRRSADLKRFLAADQRGVSKQQIDAARAAADSAGAELTAAQKRVAGAQSAVHEAQAKLTAAQANRVAAQTAPQQVAQAQSQVKTAQAGVAEAQAQVKQLKLQLSYTSIYAPTAGRVTNKSVQPGQNLQPTQPLMAIVSPDVWVVANFKETQLTDMHAGQPVEVHVDTYPDKVFKAKVQSIQAGTGSAFSLLPPENATGNFVKVVQRIPVKITFDDDAEARRLLAIGMSVVPTVNTGVKPSAPAPIAGVGTHPTIASRE